jgi:hypothetical protein
MTEQQIAGLRQWYDVMKANSELVELRLFEPNSNKVYSGYFTNIDTIITELQKYELCNCYYTLNRIDEALYSRSQKDHFMLKCQTTADNNIIGYDWILVDCDCEKPVGVMSTDEELSYAKKKANEIYAYLRSENFENPIVAVSGSGVHLLYRVSLKNNDERRKLVKDFLEALGLMFSDDRVKIDASVANPSRIARLEYTVNRKGSNTTERPWRMSYFVKIPDVVKITDPVYIERIAKIANPVVETPSRENHYQSPDKFNLEAFISKYNIKVAKKTETPQYTKYVLAECPFDSSHKAPDSALFAFKNGGYQFVCLHQSCRAYTFRDFRLHFDPHAYDNATYAEYIHKRSYYGMRPEFVPEPITEDKGAPWLKISEIKKTELGPEEYIPSGIESLDARIIGFKIGQVSVWSGRRGCAKSTLVNMLILNAANRGYRTALFTGELSGGEQKQWLMLQAAGRQFNQQSKFNDFYFTPNNIVEKIEPWLDKYFRMYNNMYSADILNIEEKVRKLHAEWPFQILCIDNLMVMSISELGENDEWNNQKKLLNKLTTLARELKIHIHLLAHPNKAKDWITIDSISGSGNIGNYAQNVFLVSRIFEDTFEQQVSGALSKKVVADILSSGCTNIIEIAKLRDKGAAVGNVIKLWFEIESNRLKGDPYEVVNYNWQENPVQQCMGFEQANYEIGLSSFASDATPDIPFALPDNNEEAPF